ncbi:Crp/Fnr family transcriptional regulator [Mycobacterium sp. ITM-2017-0098]|nr:Crp/Fnr family transcriptional regulator [Mycobacterium sp. ITM-2017-0098]
MGVIPGGATVFSGIFCEPSLPDLLSSTEGVSAIGYRAGEVIFAEGDEGGKLYLVSQGRVRVGCHASDGRECMFTVLGPSEIFGEDAALDSGPRTACAIALTDLHGFSLTTRALVSLMTADPGIAERLLRVLSRRIRWTTSNITDALHADVAARVAKKLLGFAQRFGVQEGSAMRVPMDLTQEQFAHLVGASRESVNKALCDFNQRGWIRTEATSILICDTEPLMSRAQRQRRQGRRSVGQGRTRLEEDPMRICS